MLSTTKPNLMTEPPPVEFVARYTSKDLILYALAIGFGSSTKKAEKELRFLYENHDAFIAVPTFVLALQFWAAKSGSGDSGTSLGIQQFPPPMMRKMGIVPKSSLRCSELPKELPVLHMWQSITWHRPLPMPTRGKSDQVFDFPVETKLQGRFISVVPKSVGTFVTNETSIIWKNDKSFRGMKIGVEEERICTLRSTALVMGFPKEDVRPYKVDEDLTLPNKCPEIPTERPPDYKWSYATTSTQALLYRIASGDSNSIHVDTSTSEILGSSKAKPLLHGLCTLGFVVRAIFDFISENRSNISVKYIECKFVRPVWVGDVLGVKLWKMQIPLGTIDNLTMNVLGFTVHNENTGETVVDRGVAEVHVQPETSSINGCISKSRI